MLISQGKHGSTCRKGFHGFHSDSFVDGWLLSIFASLPNFPKDEKTFASHDASLRPVHFRWWSLTGRWRTWQYPGRVRRLRAGRQCHLHDRRHDLDVLVRGGRKDSHSSIGVSGVRARSRHCHHMPDHRKDPFRSPCQSGFCQGGHFRIWLDNRARVPRRGLRRTSCGQSDGHFAIPAAQHRQRWKHNGTGYHGRRWMGCHHARRGWSWIQGFRIEGVYTCLITIRGWGIQGKPLHEAGGKCKDWHLKDNEG